MVSAANKSLWKSLLSMLLLGLGGQSFAQEASVSLDTEVSVKPRPDSDAVSRYEIEVVAFAYNAFDPTEEDLSHQRVTQAPNGSRKAEDVVDHTLSPPRRDAGSPPQSTGQKGFVAAPDQLLDEPFQFEMLQPSELELTSASRKLQSLDAYTVLVHGGWIQAGLSEDAAHDFDISIFGEPRLSGTVTLHIARFAHVAAAIDYRASLGPRSVPQAGPTDRYTGGAAMSSSKFELRQTRKLRSGELHYLDHPAFGLLLTIRPREPDST
jgi:hypothetical protein